MRFAISYAAQQVSGLWSWVNDEDHVEKAFDFAGMGARNGVTVDQYAVNALRPSTPYASLQLATGERYIPSTGVVFRIFAS